MLLDFETIIYLPLDLFYTVFFNFIFSRNLQLIVITKYFSLSTTKHFSKLSLLRVQLQLVFKTNLKSSSTNKINSLI
jgi:bacteriorhodopsin